MNVKSTALAAAVLAALLLTACSSSGTDSAYNQTHGAIAEDGAVYGTGPDRTRPYPQHEPVNLNGVGGASIRYELPSRGGNKDYTVLGENYQVWTGCNSYLEIGTASWYGPGFHGNNTSNGEYYNQKGFTAAHKNLPLPSYLKVTNLENGRAVIVRVNDRGPFHGQRIIDLSEGAAAAIGMIGKGTATVKLELIDVRQGDIIANQARTPEQGYGSAALAQNDEKGDRISDFIRDLDLPGGQVYETAAVQPEPAPSPYSSPALENSGSDITIPAAIYGQSRSPGQGYASDTNRPAAWVGSTGIGSAAALNASSSAGSVYAQGSGRGGYVQIFSTGDQRRASQIQQDYSSNTSYPVEVAAEQGLYRVRIGPVPENDLQRVLRDTRNQGYADAFIKR